MARGRGLFGRVVAYCHHGVAAARLEPYRRGGIVVYRLLDQLRDVRGDAQLRHGDPWRYPVEVQTALLCGGNAFALQLLADRMVDADAVADPRTAGFVDRLL